MLCGETACWSRPGLHHEENSNLKRENKKEKIKRRKQSRKGKEGGVKGWMNEWMKAEGRMTEG